MPNNITLASRFVPILDAIYQEAALSGVLDSTEGLIQWMSDTKEFKLAKLSMDGLGDYDRSLGYPKGDVSLVWETHSPDYERGRMFTVDTMDDEESVDVLFANLAGEFLRTKVIPELDAYRFAAYTALAGAIVSANLATGEAIIAALRTGISALDEAQVPAEGRYLFITPTLFGVTEDMDTTKSKAVLGGFSSVIKVPQARFRSAINLLDGVSTGETAGGYAPAAGSKALNFLIIHKPAVLQSMKHVEPKMISAAANQDADAWKFGYRAYGIASVQELKHAGIYAHTAA
jgi:hypothetical protein